MIWLLVAAIDAVLLFSALRFVQTGEPAYQAAAFTLGLARYEIEALRRSS